MRRAVGVHGGRQDRALRDAIAGMRRIDVIWKLFHSRGWEVQVREALTCGRGGGAEDV